LYYVERDVIVGSHNAAALGLAQDINQAVAGSNGGRMRATVDAIGAYVQLLLEDIDAVSFDIGDSYAFDAELFERLRRARDKREVEIAATQGFSDFIAEREEREVEGGSGGEGGEVR
jgi:hypothetical protein